MKALNLNLIAGIFGVGLLLTPVTQAQTVTPPKGSTTTVNVTGCLAQGPKAHEYSIKDTNGTSYGLLPDRGIRMKRHVGQEVMITGNQIKAKKEIREANESGTPADNEYLRVYQLKKVSGSCS